MAQNRLAKILKGMALRKELKTSHYKIYLCLFAAAQEGISHNLISISEGTGMHTRTTQRAIKDLLDSGNVSQDSEGWISLTFDPGIQFIEPSIQKGEFVASGAKSDQKLLTHAETLSMLNLISYNTKYISSDQISNIRNKKRNVTDISLIILDLPKEDLMGPDIRFKKLVDGIFEIYENETGNKLNPIFGQSDAAMVKRLLKRMPEESVERLLGSFKNFIQSGDTFHVSQIRRAPVRYWATRVNEFLPEKEVDLKKLYAKMLKEED